MCSGKGRIPEKLEFQGTTMNVIRTLFALTSVVPQGSVLGPALFNNLSQLHGQ